MLHIENYSDARANLAALMEKVCDDHLPVVITRQKSRPVVLMSLEDYNSIETTDYLLRSPANAKFLRESRAQVDAGDVVIFEHPPE
jgi:antitoxin YefM